MADRLSIDIDQLERLRLKLSQVTNLLGGDDIFSPNIADHVGHDRLAQRVRDFSTSWNYRRRELVARLDRVEDAVGKVGTSFGSVETELTKAIAQAPPAAAPQASKTNSDRSESRLPGVGIGGSW